MLDHNAESAKTLVLVALIVEAVVLALIILYFASIFAIFSVITPVNPGGSAMPAPGFYFSGIIIFVIVATIFGAIGALWILLDYYLVYRRLVEERVEEAQSPALVLGILQLILGGIIPGILLIVAYSQIANSVSNRMRQSGNY